MTTNHITGSVLRIILNILIGHDCITASFLPLPLLDDWMLFPKIRCGLRMRSLDFKLGAFDQYTKFFRNDSVLTLAQTGQYIGATNIEEYVKFSFSATSPYFGYGGPGTNTSSFVQYKNGQCEFSYIYYSNYTMDIETSIDVPSSFGIVAMVKIYFDYRKRYISSIHAFYTDDLLRVSFDVLLNSIAGRRFICSVMEGPCSAILNTPPNSSNFSLVENNGTSCDSVLAQLPTTTGSRYYVDGKSQGCRALHAVFANTNPTNHCAHLSVAPMKDPSGAIKCQTSKDIVPSDLFIPRDMELFQEFCESVGINPLIGHTLAGY